METLMRLLRSLIGRLFGRTAAKGVVGMTIAGAPVGYQSAIHDLRGELPVRSDIEYVTRPAEQVKGLVWHHSATRGQSIRSMAEFHTEVRKWPGIAYHFAIGFDGVVYQLNDVTTTSYHASGHNRNTIGVVLIGNYHDRELTEEMEEAIVTTNEYLRDEHELEFSWLHRETKATACPGDYAVEFLGPMLYGRRP